MKSLIVTLTILLFSQYASTQMVDVVFREIPDELDIAEAFGLDKRLFKAILQVESGMNHKAINPDTFDFGIAQINYKTAKAFGMDVPRLTRDRAYSIKMGALVLADFQRMFKHKEPDTWFCRYNVGTGQLEGNLAYLCEVYIQRVTAMLEGSHE